MEGAHPLRGGRLQPETPVEARSWSAVKGLFERVEDE